MENISMLKACKAARNTSFVAESEILEALKWKCCIGVHF
jgi:hypothetical protein